MLRTPQNVPSLTASWPNDPAQVYRLLGDIGLSFLKNLKAIYFCIKWAFQKDFFFKSCTKAVLTSFQAVLRFYLFICHLYFLRGRKAMTGYKCIVAKGVKISTDQFSPPKNQHQKSACFSPVFAYFRLFLPVFACFHLFFACFSQKLAPARKNSTNWLARLARFCNSV